MKNIFCLSMFFLAAPLSAHAAVLKQNNHQKILFAEDYSGFYVMAHTFLGMDKVRFEACDASGHATANCKFLTELSYTRLKSLQAPMLDMLRQYREEVNEKKDNFWLFFSRAGMKSRDVEAIGQMIGEIEQNGLGHLLMLTEENVGKSAPRMTTPEFARELTARMKAILETGAPMSAADCPPPLRPPGL